MKDFTEIENWTEKKIRQLKMNINNRLESFKKSESPKELQKSHMLFGLEQGDLEALLVRIKKIEKEKR